MNLRFDIDSILADSTKRIEGDIFWRPHQTRRRTQEFKVDVLSDSLHAMRVVGWCNPNSKKVNLTLFLKQELSLLRVFAFNTGLVEYRCADGRRISGSHAHRWSTERQELLAEPRPHLPSWDQPGQLWLQFCGETKIHHQGVMHPPEWQGDLSL